MSNPSPKIVARHSVEISRIQAPACLSTRSLLDNDTVKEVIVNLARLPFNVYEVAVHAQVVRSAA